MDLIGRCVRKATAHQKSGSDRDVQTADHRGGEFYLDDETRMEITGPSMTIPFPRWKGIDHCIDRRHSLIVIAGEEVRIIARLAVSNDDRIFVRFAAGLPNISDDGLTLELVFFPTPTGTSEIPIASFYLEGGEQGPYWREAELGITHLPDARGTLGFVASQDH